MIDYELQELFNRDSVNKQFRMEFPGGTITNAELHEDSFTLNEALSTDNELVFGSCEASSIEFTVSNVFTGLNNASLDVSVVLDHNTDKPFKIGKYKVYSNVPTADRIRRDIVAYDAMYDIINANVAEWYNTILPNNDSSVTLRAFRYSFFDYFGIEQEEITLPNDDMIVNKTVQTDKLSGKDVVTAICEINGCFGNINRDGAFRYVFLKPILQATYPCDDLYPSDDLFPGDENSIVFNRGNYYECRYEDYVVKKIDALEIRQSEESLGVSVGDGNNRYVMSGNMLILGKTTEELTVIAQNIFDVIKSIEYRPFESTTKGNLCYELGDLVRFNTKYDIVRSYILERRITGIQNLVDTYTASGEEYRTAQVNGLQSDVAQLRGKTNVLERTIDQTRSEIADVERGLSSQITQTADAIRSEVSSEITETKEYADNSAQNALENAENSTDEKLKSYSTTSQMNSAISQSAESIYSEVSKQVDETKEYADEVSQDALDAANKNTDEKLKSYSTTSQMRSEITQTAETINLEVEKQITETKEYADEVSDSALQSANANVDNKLKSYSTTTQMNSAIQSSADSINLTVSKQITETKEYADGVAEDALKSANSNTDEKLKSYSTTTQMNSAISQSAQGIRAEVSQEITTTKTYADTVANSALQSANSNTDNKLKSYSTTSQMNSAIDQTATSIRSEVSRTYATKNETEELSSEIDQTAESVAVVIDKNGNIVTDLTLDKNGMTFVGNYIVIDTANFKLDEDGAEFSGYVEALSLSARDIIKMYQQSELGVATEEVDVMQFVSKFVTPGYTQSILLIGGDGSYIIRFVSPTYFNSSAHVSGVMSVGGLLTATGGITGDLNGKVICRDKTYRAPIGSSDNLTYDIAYITSKAQNASGAYLITVNGLWEAGEFASHNIVSASSDIRLKENIADTKIKNALDVVNKFKVREFDWKESGAHQDIGFVADELQEIDERLAVGGGYEEDGTPNYKTVDSFYMQGYLVKAIQELSAENKELRKEIDELKKSVSFLMEKLGGIEHE